MILFNYQSFRRALPLILVAALVCACTPTAGGVASPTPRETIAPTATVSSKPPADCPVASPPENSFTAPEPWPEQTPFEGEYFFGDEELWTSLPVDGVYNQAERAGHFLWWSEKFDVHEDERPDLKIIVSRLDGEAPVFQIDEATNAFEPSVNWTMLAGIELATPGCWAFEGKYKGASLSFVLWVPEVTRRPPSTPSS